MDKEREIVLKYTTKEEREGVRNNIKVFGIAAGILLIGLGLSQYIVWLFYEFELLDGIWDVVPPGEDTPILIALLTAAALTIFMFKWFTWMEPDRDERSIIKERYGVEYDTGEMGSSVEDDER